MADLYGIQYDLRSVVDYCNDFLAKEYPAASIEDSRIMTALCVAAVVAYGRTLASGVRSGITKEQLERLPQELQEKHRYFKDFRDKFVAHSVNAFEESSVKAYLVPEERGPRAISSISVQHGRVMMLSPYDMTSLKELATFLLEVAGAEEKEERGRVLAYAQSLPIDPFYEGDAGLAFSPADSAVSVTRQRFK